MNVCGGRELLDNYPPKAVSKPCEPLSAHSPIWTCWWQGEEQMPPVVKACLCCHEALCRCSPGHSHHTTQLCGLCHHAGLRAGETTPRHHRPDALLGHPPHDAATGTRGHLDGQHTTDSLGKIGRLHPSGHRLLELPPHHTLSQRLPRRLGEFLRGSRQRTHPSVLHRRPASELLETTQPLGGLPALGLLLRRGAPRTSRSATPD